MLRTRREALDEFLDFVGEPDDSTARTLAAALLNRSLERLWLLHPWRDYQAPAYQLTCVASTRSYALPDSWGRLGKGAVRNLTRGSRLDPLWQEELDTYQPSAGTSLETQGIPTHYILAGMMPVQTQPATTGEALEVVSSSTSDTAVRVTVEGLNTSNQIVRTQVTLTGQTAVAVGTFARIDAFGKSYPAGTSPATASTTSVGTVTLRKVSDSSTLQALLPTESAVEHRQVTLYPTPNVTDTLAFPWLRRPKRLLYDGDPLPGDWWPALFDIMVLGWRDNTGELPTAALTTLSAVQQLIRADNANGPKQPPKPFGGMAGLDGVYPL